MYHKQKKTFAGEENLSSVIAVLNMPNLPENLRPLHGLILDCIRLQYAANKVRPTPTADSAKAWIQFTLSPALAKLGALEKKVNDSLNGFQGTPRINGVLSPEGARLESRWSLPFVMDAGKGKLAVANLGNG